LDFKDYYTTLGVPKKASADEIQKAYRKLARKYHPDVNRTPEAEDKFKEITESYEVLKDPEKRQTYDQFGKNWKNYQGSGGMPPGFESIFSGAGGNSGFSSFFEGLFGRRRSLRKWISPGQRARSRIWGAAGPGSRGTTGPHSRRGCHGRWP